MKILKIVLIVAAVLAIMMVGYRFYTKSHSPAAVAEFNKNGLALKVDYCRPSKKGRILFAEDGLVPFGKVWRTGANEATVISFNRDVTIAGQALKAGTYTLWTVPNADKWTIVINGETGQWGTNYNPTKDVLRVDVPTGTNPDLEEMFLIKFDDATTGADMVLHWDTTEVAVPIR